eukprot:CAMPEP_0167747952 /NCGR_PEP_ID=MMETSP0110_2-20121227/4569_1 /TAXON_ID=629695 /ORGANISM="Gymnochlora sp., Strain CCMP2014" /LENGTH=2368 /DNA_ID=CAMNT_0007632915 /DNA_START=71 /DNA_END=7177 /DNA_ORIENTATION=-
MASNDTAVPITKPADAATMDIPVSQSLHEDTDEEYPPPPPEEDLPPEVSTRNAKPSDPLSPPNVPVEGIVSYASSSIYEPLVAPPTDKSHFMVSSTRTSIATRQRTLTDVVKSMPPLDSISDASGNSADDSGILEAWLEKQMADGKSNSRSESKLRKEKSTLSKETMERKEKIEISNSVALKEASIRLSGNVVESNQERPSVLGNEKVWTIPKEEKSDVNDLIQKEVSSDLSSGSTINSNQERPYVLHDDEVGAVPKQEKMEMKSGGGKEFSTVRLSDNVIISNQGRPSILGNGNVWTAPNQENVEGFEDDTATEKAMPPHMKASSITPTEELQKEIKKSGEISVSKPIPPLVESKELGVTSEKTVDEISIPSMFSKDSPPAAPSEESISENEEEEIPAAPSEDPPELNAESPNHRDSDPPPPPPALNLEFNNRKKTAENIEKRVLPAKTDSIEADKKMQISNPFMSPQETEGKNETKTLSPRRLKRVKQSWPLLNFWRNFEAKFNPEAGFQEVRLLTRLRLRNRMRRKRKNRRRSLSVKGRKARFESRPTLQSGRSIEEDSGTMSDPGSIESSSKKDFNEEFSSSSRPSAPAKQTIIAQTIVSKSAENLISLPGVSTTEKASESTEEEKFSTIPQEAKVEAVLLRIHMKMPIDKDGKSQDSVTILSVKESDTLGKIMEKCLFKRRQFLYRHHFLDGSLEWGLLLRKKQDGEVVKNDIGTWLDTARKLSEYKIDNEKMALFCLPKNQIIRIRVYRTSLQCQSMIVSTTVTPKELCQLVNEKAKLGLMTNELSMFELRPFSTTTREKDWLTRGVPLYLQSCWTSVMYLVFSMKFPLASVGMLNDNPSKAIVGLIYQQVQRMTLSGNLVRYAGSRTISGVSNSILAPSPRPVTPEAKNRIWAEFKQSTTSFEFEENGEELMALSTYITGYSDTVPSYSYIGLSDEIAYRVAAMEEVKLPQHRAMELFIRLYVGQPVKLPQGRRDARLVWFEKGNQPGFTVQEDLIVTFVAPDSGAEARGVAPGWRVIRIDDTWISSKEIMSHVLQACINGEKPFQVQFFVHSFATGENIGELKKSPRFKKHASLTRVGLNLRLFGRNLRGSPRTPASKLAGGGPDAFIIVKAGNSEKILYQTIDAKNQCNVLWEDIFITTERFGGPPTLSTILRIECWDPFGLIGATSATIADLLERPSTPPTPILSPGNSSELSPRMAIAISTEDIERPSAPGASWSPTGKLRFTLQRPGKQGKVVHGGTIEVLLASVNGELEESIKEAKRILNHNGDHEGKHWRKFSLNISEPCENFRVWEVGASEAILKISLSGHIEIIPRPKRTFATEKILCRSIDKSASLRVAKVLRMIGEGEGRRHLLELHFVAQNNLGPRTQRSKLQKLIRKLSFESLSKLYHCQHALESAISTGQMTTATQDLSQSTNVHDGAFDEICSSSKTYPRRRRKRQQKSNNSQPRESSSSVSMSPDVSQLRVLCTTYNMGKMTLYSKEKKSKEKKEKNETDTSKEVIVEEDTSPLPEAPESIMKKGILEKRGYINAAFRSRYIEIVFSRESKCFELRYHKKEGGRVEGSIVLRDSTVHGGVKSDSRKFHLLTNQRQWTFRAPSPGLRAKWVVSLRWYISYQRVTPPSPVAANARKWDSESVEKERYNSESATRETPKTPFQWLPKDYDLYAVALQECKYPHRKGFHSCEEDVCFCLLSHLGHSEYTIIRAVSMWEIRIVVIARRGISIHGVRSGYVATGVAGVLKNKGGVGVSLWIQDTRFCFVGAHLAARAKRIADRNANAFTILKDLGPSLLGGRGDAGSDTVNLVTAHDHVFFLGDLNYRVVNLPRKHVLTLLDAQRLEQLQEFEQLRKEKGEGRCLFGFDECKISFRPSYRYQTDSNEWSRAKLFNLPSWTDRILWRSSHLKGIKASRYWMDQSQLGSDHRPVLCSFHVKCYRVLSTAASSPDLKIGSKNNISIEKEVQNSQKEESVSQNSSASSGYFEHESQRSLRRSLSQKLWWVQNVRAQVTFYEVVIKDPHPALGTQVGVVLWNPLLRDHGHVAFKCNGYFPNKLSSALFSPETVQSTRTRSRDLQRRIESPSSPASASTAASSQSPQANRLLDLKNTNTRPRGRTSFTLGASTINELSAINSDTAVSGLSESSPILDGGIFPLRTVDTKKERSVCSEQKLSTSLVENGLRPSLMRSKARRGDGLIIDPLLEHTKAGKILGKQRASLSTGAIQKMSKKSLKMVWARFKGKEANGDLDNDEKEEEEKIEIKNIEDIRGPKVQTIGQLYGGGKLVAPRVVFLRMENVMRCILARQAIRLAVRSLDTKSGGNSAGFSTISLIPPLQGQNSEPMAFTTPLTHNGKYRGMVTGWAHFQWLPGS